MLALRTIGVAISLALVLIAVPAADAAGANLHKSGPIQITSDGAFIWTVNPDHDSVSRLATNDNSVTQFALPAGGPHRPTGLAIGASGSEIWVAAEASDRVFVLDSTSGGVLATITLPHGSAPHSIAISPDGAQAIVPLFRRGAIAFIATGTRTIQKIIDGVATQPFSACYTGTANLACVAHRFNDGEHAYVTCLNTAAQTVTAVVRMASTSPKFLVELNNDPPEIDAIPEAGYLFPTSHVAERPGANALWLPVQYQNFDSTVFTQNSSIQSALHRINLTTLTMNPEDRVVYTAVYAHSNTSNYIGPGWNAEVSGPADLAFDASGATAYLVHQYSNDVLIAHATAGPDRPGAADPLVEIPVGDQPIGIAVSPTTDRAYVLNRLSRDVSVLDLTAKTELLRVPITPGTPEPLPANILLGSKIFNTSDDPRLSGNSKISCASCHPNGESDGMPWDNFQFGNGTRKTLHLSGQSLSFAPQSGGRGQLHRSGDRDEVQDFDHTFRGALMGGTGILPIANPPLGASNAGLEADLDAMADYVLNLDAVARSPFRNADGSLPDSAIRGAAIFNAGPASSGYVGCNVCHPAPAFTDLDFHDIGGFAPAPENEGPTFNTPSLVSAWAHRPLRQVLGGDDNSRQSGMEMIELVDRALNGLHGDTTLLTRTQRRDLAAFLDVLDGDLAAAGVTEIVDTQGPRVLAVYPLDLNTVEVVFDETIDANTGGDPNNYKFNDGYRNVTATAAVVDPVLGNHARVTVELHYYGCDKTYTFLPGPIHDVAGQVSGGEANLLEINNAANHVTFTLDGTITVTFGDTGIETFAGVGRDASFQNNAANFSHTHVRTFPSGSPEQKGFVSFDFVPKLSTACSVVSGSKIVDARFSGLPDFGHANTLEIRRVFKPWGDPPQDFCTACIGSVTRSFATYPTIPWSASGAGAIGGPGTNPAEYHPTSTFDLSSAVDATVAVSALDERVEFAGASVTNAFRFWLDNPTKNFGHSLEIVGNVNGTGMEFWGNEADGGRKGWTLSVTYTLDPETTFADCNDNGIADECDIANGMLDEDGDAIPDACEALFPTGDANCDGVLDFFDIDPFLLALFDASGYIQQYPLCSRDQADVNGDLVIDFFDIDPFLDCLFNGCP